jgi:cyclopropane-fatty-acyl-phospholipid synthase
VCRAARHHGAHAHGITLSQRQFDFARRRIRDEGLEDRVTVELRDFRDLSADTVYDKVSSIGLFLNHGVTHEEEGWNRTVAAELINRDVFPDAELDRVGDIQSGMERAGFEILDVEGPRPHHVLTLKHWVERLDAHRDAAIREKDRVVPRSRHSRPRS